MAKRHRWGQEVEYLASGGRLQRCIRCETSRLLNGAGNLAAYKRPDGTISSDAGPCEPKEKEAAHRGFADRGSRSSRNNDPTGGPTAASVAPLAARTKESGHD